MRGPKHVLRRGRTPVLAAGEAQALIRHIDASTLVGRRDRALIGVMLHGRPTRGCRAAAFVDAMAELKVPATMRRYVASLNHLHRAAGLPAPGQAEPVRLALRRMARTRGCARSRPRRSAGTGCVASWTPSATARPIFATLPSSELVALDVKDIGRDGDGTGTVLIRRSKTDQEGAGRVAFVSAASQLPVDAWHAVIDEPTFADAILDRLVHSAYRLDRDGPSMRKLKAASKPAPARP